jgi:hypothetical protein
MLKLKIAIFPYVTKEPLELHNYTLDHLHEKCLTYLETLVFVDMGQKRKFGNIIIFEVYGPL